MVYPCWCNFSLFCFLQSKGPPSTQQRSGNPSYVMGAPLVALYNNTQQHVSFLASCFSWFFDSWFDVIVVLKFPQRSWVTCKCLQGGAKAATLSPGSYCCQVLKGVFDPCFNLCQPLGDARGASLKGKNHDQNSLLVSLSKTRNDFWSHFLAVMAKTLLRRPVLFTESFLTPPIP